MKKNNFIRESHNLENNLSYYGKSRRGALASEIKESIRRLNAHAPIENENTLNEQFYGAEGTLEGIDNSSALNEMSDKKILSEDKWDAKGEYRVMQDKFGNMDIGDVVPIVNAFTKWDYENITSLVKQLLTDANFHSESQEVADFMKKISRF